MALPLFEEESVRCVIDNKLSMVFRQKLNERGGGWMGHSPPWGKFSVRQVIDRAECQDCTCNPSAVCQFEH